MEYVSATIRIEDNGVVKNENLTEREVMQTTEKKIFLGQNKGVIKSAEIPENIAKMENGKIEYGPVKDTAASTNTTWKTEGFIIKNKKTNGDPTKGKKGEIWLKDGEIRSWIKNGAIYTIFTFPEKRVSAQLENAGVNAKTLKESGGYIYLNAIIQVYENGKPTGEYYRTLEGIKSARDWKNTNDFEDRFDIQVEYKPVKQDVKIIFQALVNGKLVNLETVPQESVFTHSYFTTNGSNIPAKKIGSKTSKKYYLYQVHYKNPGIDKGIHGIEKTSLNPLNNYEAYNNELPRIRHRSFEVQQGGLEVYALYKEFKKMTAGEETMEGEIEEPILEAIIRAEERGNEQYEVEEGIPVTKNLYINGFTNEYLIKYRFKRVSGKKYYPVTIKRNYYLKWTQPVQNGEEITYIPQTQLRTVRKTYTVERTYSYWIVEQLHGYRVAKMELQNGAFPTEREWVEAKGDGTSEFIFKKSDTYIKEPKIEEYELSERWVSGGTVMPSIPYEDWSYEAEKYVPTIKVRNDHLIFKGKEYMGASWCEGETKQPEELPTITDVIDQDILYKKGITIPVMKANGFYESSGNVFYEAMIHVGSGSMGEQLTYPIQAINGVFIHTPVLCRANISDERKYNQLKNPNNVIASLILDREFQTSISTYGEHRDIKGYGEQDYRAFTYKKQVKFPFDVYDGERYCSAGNWLDIDGTATYYLPTWVTEGIYTIQYRCLSLNGVFHQGELHTEEYANFSEQNYTATDAITVQVVGRLYGFAIKDISDYPLWQSIFRKENSLEPSGNFYSVGVKDCNGKRTAQKELYTLPLFEKSYPQKELAGIMKSGYFIRFTVDTIGTMYGTDDYIRIKPKFYYMERDGSMRREVDVYYSETVNKEKWNFIKMGSPKDLTNQKSYKISEPYFSVSSQEKKRVCEYLGLTYEQWKNWEKPVFTYLNIMIPDSLRTFIGEKRRSGISPAEPVVGKSMQRWYGQYGIPSEIYVTEKDMDIQQYANAQGLLAQSDCWLKDGYLVLQFDIQTIKNKEIHLDYINEENEKKGYCNMWKLEGYSYEKEKVNGAKVSFESGDILVYDLQNSAARDYKIGGTH